MLAPMLTVLFVGLKLTGHIDWSWWWLASPMLIVCTIAGIQGGVAEWRRQTRGPGL